MITRILEILCGMAMTALISIIPCWNLIESARAERHCTAFGGELLPVFLIILAAAVVAAWVVERIDRTFNI